MPERSQGSENSDYEVLVVRPVNRVENTLQAFCLPDSRDLICRNILVGDVPETDLFHENRVDVIPVDLDSNLGFASLDARNWNCWA